MEKEQWELPRFQSPPTALEFTSQFEANNMPVVYEGCIKTWAAYTKWNPESGGLSYLKSIANTARIQVMLSTHGSLFCGDIRSHERVSMSFGGFLDYALSKTGMVRNMADKTNNVIDAVDPEGGLLIGDNQLYLAQVPIFSREQEEQCPLNDLMQDILIPGFLEPTCVTNINLWMSAEESTSSTHYDPFHNILCIVAGTKEVTMWPPSATPFLYPNVIHGEASNHSAVDLLKPDYKKHPLCANASTCCQVVMLNSGDALFIPEGWYHKVQSASLTIAVNIWWASKISLALNSHMDGYYLRRIVSSLLDREKERIINTAATTIEDGKIEGLNTQGKILLCSNSGAEKSGASTGECIVGMSRERELSIEILNPLQRKCLQCLCIRATDASAEVQQDPHNKEHVEPDEEQVKTEGLRAERGIIASLSILDPSALKEVLLVMARHFPRTLENLVLQKLTPLTADFLTRKFDEMDSTFPETEQEQFYKVFYSAFENPRMAMSALLDGKESFSAMALNSMLERFLGCKVKLGFN